MTRNSAPRRSPNLHPARAGRLAKRRVVFIDFGGVVHPALPKAPNAPVPFSTVPHFGWLPVLVRMQRPHPDVDVVVHSSWREVYDEDELRELLSAVGERVLDATASGLQYDSILSWLGGRSEYASFRSSDDDASEFPDPPPPQLILCDPNEGIAGQEAAEALSRWLAE